LSQEIIIIECFDLHNRQVAQERFVLTDDHRTFTVGRSVLNDVCLTDPYAAELHASIEITPDRQIIATDLRSVNGILVGGKRVDAANAVALPDHSMQVGQTYIKIRTSWEQLEPEKSNHWISMSVSNNSIWLASLAVIAFVLQTAYTTWLDAPLDLIGTGVSAITGNLAVVVCWVALWTLLTRVIIGQWRWLNHIAIGFGITTIYMFVTDIYTLGWFAFSLPGYRVIELVGGTVAVMVLIYFHLRFASNASVEKVLILAVLIPGLGIGSSFWLLERSTAKDVNVVGTGIRVYPPGFRFTGSEKLEDYFASMSTLQNTADQMRDDLPPADDGTW